MGAPTDVVSVSARTRPHGRGELWTMKKNEEHSISAAARGAFLGVYTAVDLEASGVVGE